jgi:hypothetical protein
MSKQTTTLKELRADIIAAAAVLAVVLLASALFHMGI